MLLWVGVLAALVDCQGKGVSVADTDLLIAAWDGNLAIVKSLLDQGADVNVRDKHGATALLYAAQRGHVEIIQVLLAHNNVDVNAKDVADVTALMEALRSGHLAVVKLLLEHNADSMHGIKISTQH